MVNCCLFKTHLYKQNNDNNNHKDKVTFFLEYVRDFNSEKAMAFHSSTLAWKIPGTEEPVGLQSTGSLRVRHD